MKRMLPALALVCALPVHAFTISGDASFEVVSAAFPDEVGSGHFTLLHSRLVDFELTMFGETFDEFDMVRHCTGCVADPIAGVLEVALSGAFGSLDWSFRDGNFAIVYDFDGIAFRGTRENGTAGSVITHTLRIPDPGSFGLLLLGLFALPATRRLT